MPFPDLPQSTRAEYERIGRERALASREADRVCRRELLRVCAEMIGCTAAGLLGSGFAFHVTDHEYGMVLLYAGMGGQRRRDRIRTPDCVSARRASRRLVTRPATESI
jgi:hypothetical protein